MPRDPTAISKGFFPNIAPVPFANYARDGWSLEVECWSCGRVVYHADPAAKFGPHASAGTLFKRLVCECGEGLPSMRAVVLGNRDAR